MLGRGLAGREGLRWRMEEGGAPSEEGFSVEQEVGVDDAERRRDVLREQRRQNEAPPHPASTRHQNQSSARVHFSAPARATGSDDDWRGMRAVVWVVAVRRVRASTDWARSLGISGKSESSSADGAGACFSAICAAHAW